MRPLAAAALAAALGLAAASPALADTLKVPSEAYPTIQSAVDAAADGDTVLVAPGDYAEIVMVMDKTNVTIRGRGYPSINAPGFAFSVTNGTGVAISGFQVVGGGGGVSATMSTDVAVTKVKVAAPTTLAFEFLQCTGVLLSRCEVTDAVANVVQDTSSLGLRIEKCRFLNNAAGDVIRLSPSAGGTGGSNGAIVSKNRIEGGDTAIRFAGTNALVEKNRMSALASKGIVVDGTTDTDGSILSKNRIDLVGGSDGIEIVDTQVTVVKNTITGGRIRVSGNDSILDRNTVRASTGSGFILVGDGILVTRNKVLEAADHGISLADGAFTLDRNKVVGVNGSGINLQQTAAGSVLTRNSAIACDSFGIVVYAMPVTLTGNRATGNGSADYGDTNDEGVNTLSGNRFGTALYNIAP
jgi:hypothetical protein